MVHPERLSPDRVAIVASLVRPEQLAGRAGQRLILGAVAARVDRLLA